MLRQLIAITAALVLVACSNGALREQPAQLPETLPSEANLKVQWWRILDSQADANAFAHLNPTVVDEAIYVPLANGELFELDQRGKTVRQFSLGAGITAQVSYDNEQFLVLNNEGQAGLYDTEFERQWQTKLGALSIEPALITDSRIFVQTIDGRLNALERITGRLLWAYQDAEPNLTITGTSAPVLVNTAQGEAVITGLSNGKVVALSVTDGAILWEYRIARASGSTDISRLVDIDAQATLLGNRLLISGYQGDLVVIDVNSGRVLQAAPFSSYRAVKSDGRLWYGVNAQSHLVAIDPATMNEVWRVESFQYRQLSDLLIDGDYLFVADIKGYVHLLNKADGQWLTSRQIDWKGSNGEPVKYLDGILFQGSSSRIKYLTVQ
ncbi:PQQ-binding-like beta-propeller repeat protein [Reinekea thalattae]|uniref:Outer membrane protein assembly factor BamB n=1 Tax=Reinekea thalattae TaxID=2593301 RepID=A0A5C8Z6R2_9GAMM|nr:PQQ-binding-like beta-propeller repeat protein [Reinekea thalattae]TXR53317.1 PQQ-binding-like beta-propeller repeat protein [Reinekea thalattae]